VKWLEMIKVQASSGQAITTESEIMSLISDIQKNPDYPGLMEFTIYCHVSVPGFFSVHLSWDSQYPQIRGSVAGLNLAQTLKTFGLVDHSVWMETI
jgi:hypothetical protein